MQCVIIVIGTEVSLIERELRMGIFLVGNVEEGYGDLYKAPTKK